MERYRLLRFLPNKTIFNTKFSPTKKGGKYGIYQEH